MVKIAPSILSANFSILEKEVQDVVSAGADYIHIDVMDGNYVPNISFGPEIVKSIRSITKKPLDVHLMIKPVKNFIEVFAKSGANIISFHPEAEEEPLKVINLIRSLNCKPGIAIHPNIQINKIMGKNPRRVSHIKIIININGELTDKEKQLLIKAAKHCPVSKSIHPEIKEEVVFNFN